MPQREVVEIPDARLKLRCAPAGAPDPALADDLVDTMRASPGCVGLAAPQIGVGVRAFCLDVSGHPQVARHGWRHHGLVVLFDPELVAAGRSEVRREGCTSVPHFTADVRRALEVTVRGIGLDGAERVYEAEAFEARAFQHELDHLDGYLVLDRVAAAAHVFRRTTYQ